MINHQKVCVLRTDHRGCQCRGYLAEMSERLYEELAIDRGWLERIEVDQMYTVICNREGAVMGLPLNRALYDARGNLVTVVGGNMIVEKVDAGGVRDVCADDIGFIEGRLRAVLAISHGFVFTKKDDELQDWTGKEGCFF